MLFRSVLWPGVLAPGLAAALAVLVLRGADRQGRDTSAGGGSLAIGVAFMAAFVSMTGWPRWPPGESTQRLFYLIAIVAAIGSVWGWRKGTGAPRVLRGGLLGLLLVAMLKAPLENTWSSGQATIWLAGLLGLGLSLGWALEAGLQSRDPSPSLALAAVRLVLLTGIALALSFSGSVRLGQLMGAVTCGVFVVEVLGRVLGRRPWLPADAMVLTTATYGLLLGGYFYASLDPWNACLLGLSLLLLAGAGRRGGVWTWLPLAPWAIALVRVVLAFSSAPDVYDYY